MDTETKTKHFWNDGVWLERLSLVLFICYLLSFLAATHWAFDLFSNFKLQYLLGSVLFCALSLLYRKKGLALCLGVLAAALFAEINYTYAHPFTAKPSDAPNFKIAQYNKFFNNTQYEKIGAWVRAEDFDVVIVNESLIYAALEMKAFKDVLPHQYPQNQTERFGDISILSKWPVTVTPLPMQWDGGVLNGSRITVQKPGLEPVVIYAYHAQVPLGASAYARRQFEMESMTAFVREDDAKNLIMMGDWNLTPWSPLFAHIIETTDLNYQNYGLWPETTWPSFNFLPAFQIPIDHILFSDPMILTDISRGPSNGSDHQSLIAQFRVNPAE